MDDALRAKDERAQQEVLRAAEFVHDKQEEFVQMGGVCDFCNTPFSELGGLAAVRGWRTDDGFTGEMSMLDRDGGTASVGLVWDPYWAACPTCDPEVAKLDPEALADFVMAHRHALAPAIAPEDVPATRADLCELFVTFYSMNPRRFSWTAHS